MEVVVMDMDAPLRDAKDFPLGTRAIEINGHVMEVVMLARENLRVWAIYDPAQVHRYFMSKCIDGRIVAQFGNSIRARRIIHPWEDDYDTIRGV
jgi:hypothetical protein